MGRYLQLSPETVGLSEQRDDWFGEIRLAVDGLTMVSCGKWHSVCSSLQRKLLVPAAGARVLLPTVRPAGQIPQDDADRLHDQTDLHTRGAQGYTGAQGHKCVQLLRTHNTEERERAQSVVQRAAPNMVATVDRGAR